MKSRKGQISIEFMLIILICLGYLQLLTVNVLEPAIDAAQDVTRLGQAKLSAEKLAVTINEMGSSLGEGKRTLHLFVPKDIIFSCSSGTQVIRSDVLLYGNATPECPNTLPISNPMQSPICRVEANIITSSLSCNVSIDTMTQTQGEFKKFSISKNNSGIVSVTVS